MYFLPQVVTKTLKLYINTYIHTSKIELIIADRNFLALVTVLKISAAVWLVFSFYSDLFKFNRLSTVLL